MQTISYNEHAPRPKLAQQRKVARILRADTPESVTLAAECTDEYVMIKRQNRNAARNRRRKLAAVKGPRQPARAPKRWRSAVRSLMSEGRKASTRGDIVNVNRIRAALGDLLKARFGKPQVSP